MRETGVNRLLRPRTKQEEAFASLLSSVFERKILIDGARGEASVDTQMVYGTLPEGGPDEFLRGLIEHQRYEFSLKTDYREADKIDRTGTLVSGPFFTSVDHPWPVGAQGYLEPLFQLDLRFASDVGGKDLGSGLLQVWMDNRSSFLRQIPESFVSRAVLAPIPLKGEWSCIESVSNTCNWAAAESGEPKWIEGGHQATGVGPARFAPHQLLRLVLEGQIIDEADRYDAVLVADAQRCISLMEFVGSSDAALVATTTNASLFGNYNPWNFDAGLETVLLNYQPDNVLKFGSGDEAGIIFYDLINAETHFSFQVED